MHTRFAELARRIALVAVALAVSVSAIADTVTLKDGTKLDGQIVRESDAFVQIKVKIGGVESVKTLLRSEIASIAKDAPAAKPGAALPSSSPDAKPAPAAPSKPAKPTPAEKALETAKRLDSTAPTRIAILNFGPPDSWHGEIGDTVGVQIQAAAWSAAVPLLEKDKIDIVVVRVNSGGGSAEFIKFQQLFQNVFKRKFRTVAWIESAISAAAMAPYTIEEFYFMPQAAYGACVGWHGNLQNMEGLELAKVLNLMEDASKMGGRPPIIMRAMQLQVPLSASINEKTGEVTWFQDTSGQYLLNPPDQILTFTAKDAVKFGFARAIAADREQLAHAMGLKEFVWAGDAAAKLIDDSMRAGDKAEKHWEVQYREFELYAGMAEQAQSPDDRAKFVGKAISALRELKSLFKGNPNLGASNGMTDEWFRDTEQQLRKLLER